VLTLVILLIKSPRSTVASFPNVFPVTSLIDAIFPASFGGLGQILDFHDSEVRQPVTL
jgi:hypothetical protein